jgi:hypothetical protein
MTTGARCLVRARALLESGAKLVLGLTVGRAREVPYQPRIVVTCSLGY